MKARFYKGVLIETAGLNSSGIRWTAFGDGGFLRADTLAGIKRLITNDLEQIEPKRDIDEMMCKLT